MTKPEFETQIARLVAQFGKGAYSTERVRLIWMTASDLPGEWFSRTVDSFLSEMRLSPLPNDFSLAASVERERKNRDDKEQSKKATAAFWAETLPGEEARAICQTIVKRALGAVPDPDWECFTRGLQTLRVSAYSEQTQSTMEK